MQSIKANDYSIYFNQEAYEMLNSWISNYNYSKLFILVDETTNEFCLPKLLPLLEVDIPIEIIEIEAGEEMKNISTCVEIWSILADLGADRKSAILNLGGGVITDLGGFVASTFKRGIDFINIPTTLLGMVDAAIGGKNGVDLGTLKNQIGVINAPKLVVIDTDYLETLPQNQLKSGLAEMLKHGLIYDKKYWNQFKDLKELNFDDLDQLIYRSIEIKNEIVLQDPTENGIRKALNFGHTLGHAIESHFIETKKPLLHGEAIAIGMILESYISKEKKLITEVEYIEIKSTLLAIFEKQFFTQNDIDSIVNLLIHDKKNEYGKVQFALIENIGTIILNQYTDNEVIINGFADYET
ncbi:3-dehydroquinate synthase [Flavobacterium sp.]|jgi:3-dehydroquinate synthase|uniref:3-dehydroquinate synthase n=1 Tax=Flavobacterium sp. TaxID=239 RepID=UPI0037C04779